MTVGVATTLIVVVKADLIAAVAMSVGVSMEVGAMEAVDLMEAVDSMGADFRYDASWG
ncbi:MAG: hypothetical protein SWY16_22220 [Cyanobacteriota bacterium]|nr:hypothetical protein [Cyanobacteriota bacterium]